MKEPHAIAGMNFMKKFREARVVLNAIGSHHGDIEKDNPIADLVDAANVISSSRPGGRGAVTPEGHIKRLESLEEVAKGFPGVIKTYALQAGREIRVIVEGENVSDSQADVLAHDIAHKIENSPVPGADQGVDHQGETFGRLRPLRRMASLYKGDETIFLYKRQSEHYRLPFALWGGRVT